MAGVFWVGFSQVWFAWVARWLQADRSLMLRDDSLESACSPGAGGDGGRAKPMISIWGPLP